MWYEPRTYKVEAQSKAWKSPRKTAVIKSRIFRKHVGNSLNDLLEFDGTLEQLEAEALKRVIVWQIQQAMGQTGVNKSQLAQKMHTSRTVVNRLLDEKDTGVTITTLVKAGRALGMTWTLESDGGNGSPRAA